MPHPGPPQFPPFAQYAAGVKADRTGMTRARKILALSCAFGAFLSLPASAASSVAPGVAGVASVVPGLGQVLDDRPGEGLAWFVTVVGGWALSPSGHDWPATAFIDLWMYNIYDAYRDAGAKRAANYSLLENYVAAFNPLNVVDPIGAPVIAVGFIGRPNGGGPALSSSKAAAPFETASIALGEEGLFRGFFFPGFTDVSGSPVAGGVFSSVLFAYAHKFYRGQSQYALQGGVFAERTIFGLLMCLQAYVHKYDLRRSIFAHTWFDAIYEYRRAGGTVGGETTQASVATVPRPNGLLFKYVTEF